MTFAERNKHKVSLAFQTFLRSVGLLKALFDEPRRNFCARAGILSAGVKTMKVTGFMLTLGAGMAAGAMASLMLPQNKEPRKTMQRAANSIDKAVSQKMQEMS